MFAFWLYFSLVSFTGGEVIVAESPHVDISGTYLRPRREAANGCPLGTYLDKGTSHCDPCAPHCIRMTEDPPTACQNFCQQMTSEDAAESKEKCPYGLYHDRVTSHCDPCSPHCDRHRLEKPPEDCITYCKELPGTAVPLLDTGPQVTNQQGNTGVIAVYVLGAVITVVVAVAIICMVVLWRRRQRRQRNEIHLNEGPFEERDTFKPSEPEETLDTERSQMVTATSTV